MKRANPQGTWPLDQTVRARALVLIDWVLARDFAIMAGVVIGFLLRGVL